MVMGGLGIVAASGMLIWGMLKVDSGEKTTPGLQASSGNRMSSQLNSSWLVKLAKASSAFSGRWPINELGLGSGNE
jgi:hypothetical protein